MPNILRAALIATLSIGWSSSLSAAQIVHSTDFFFSSQLNVDNWDFLDDPGNILIFDKIRADTQALTFNAFDSRLGTLTAATLTFRSQQEFQASVGVSARPGSVFIFENAYLATVAAPTRVLGNQDFDVPFILSCVRTDTDCFNVVTDTLRFDRGFDVLADVAPGAVVQFDLRSRTRFRGRFAYEGPLESRPFFGASGGLFWSGTATLTYSYTPVPEPQTWLMLALGFGLIGYAIRLKPFPARRALPGCAQVSI